MSRELSSHRTLRRNVARGAALLDSRRRGWWRRVTLRDLDLSDGNVCLLGQDFSKVFQRLSIEDGYGGREAYVNGQFCTSPYVLGLKKLGIRGSGITYGFDIPSSQRIMDQLGDNGAWEFLKVCWADEIAARRRRARANWPSSRKAAVV